MIINDDIRMGVYENLCQNLIQTLFVFCFEDRVVYLVTVVKGVKMCLSFTLNRSIIAQCLAGYGDNHRDSTLINH